MTIQTLLHNFAIDVQEGMSDDQIGERATALIKEIELMTYGEGTEKAWQQARHDVARDTCLALLDRLSVLDVRHPLPKHLTALDIHGWAKEQGITL